MSSDIDPKEFGAMRATIDHIDRRTSRVEDNVERLLALANQTKGAAWVGRITIGAIGGAVVWIAERVAR